VPEYQDIGPLRAAATEDEVAHRRLQFVRRLSGTTRPSRANEAAFNRAADEVTDAADA